MQAPNVFQKEKAGTPKLVPVEQGSSLSRAAVNRIVIGIILLIVLIQVGFFKTYIQHFPQFNDYTDRGRNIHINPIMHFHGMMMMGWVLMLLVQPILILKGKINLHRRVGKLSYVLAPLVLVALYLANRDQYLHLSAIAGEKAAISRLALSIPEAVYFAILYSLAIFYRHKPALHMRYMVSTAFLFVNPALGRIFRTYFNYEYGFPYSSNIVLSIVGAITIVDSVRTKRISPFALAFGLLLLHRIIWELKETPFWQATGSVIARIF